MTRIESGGASRKRFFNEGNESGINQRFALSALSRTRPTVHFSQVVSPAIYKSTQAIPCLHCVPSGIRDK